MEKPDATGERARLESVAPYGTLLELLDAYEQTLNAVDNLGPVVMVSSRSFLRFPRPTGFLRTFTVHHIERTLDAVCRRYDARTALRLDAPEDDDHRAARSYRASLPPIRRRTYALALIALAIVLASMTLPPFVAWFDVGGSSTRVSDFISALESLATNPVAVDSLLDQLRHANYDVFGYVISGVLFIIYVLLRPVSAVFRVKRMLFNSYPDVERLSAVPMSLAVRRTTGLYALEEQLFRHIGARRPPEFPFDLFVSALAMPFFLIGFSKDLDSPDPITVVVAVIVEILILVRLAWLFQTWRRRSSSQPGSIGSVIVSGASRRAAPAWALALGILSVLVGLSVVYPPFLFLFPAVAALLLARWSDAASTYSAGRYSRRRVALAAKIVACAGIVAGLMVAVWVGFITFGPTP